MAGDALIGRDEELALLGTLRDSGAAAGVVIVGPAGVGKTALARRFVSEVEADGASSSWIVATRSLATIPFGAFAPLLPPMGGSLRLEADTFTRASPPSPGTTNRWPRAPSPAAPPVSPVGRR